MTLRLSLVVCVALVLSGSAAAAPRRDLDRPNSAEIAAGPAFIADAPLRRSEAPAGFWGGVYTTRTNEHVEIYSSDSYAVDEAANQRWADFVASLVHGREIGLVAVYLAPPDEVSAMCGGEDILGCYGLDRIVAPGEDTFEVSAESVVTHEYGHEIAANRSNAPWPALAWGTKRWASYEQVCRRARAHELFPGGEGALVYMLNPGEAFAETYRVLNERKAGVPETPWRVVDESLRPNDRDLALVEQDVVDPWKTNHATTLSGRFAARGTSVRTFKVATPLDGTFSVSLQSSARMRLDVVSGTTRLARAGRVARTTVCGPRSLTIRVTRTAGSGPFTLAVSVP